jgi:hypothetical protein
MPVSLSNEDAAGRAGATSQQADLVCARPTVPLQGTRLPTTSSASTSSRVTTTTRAALRPTRPYRPSLPDTLFSRTLPARVHRPSQVLVRTIRYLQAPFIQENQPADVSLSHRNS